MLGPTIKNLLDLNADIRGKMEAGVYAVEVDELSQLTVPSEVAMQSVYSRGIEVGPVTNPGTG